MGIDKGARKPDEESSEKRVPAGLWPTGSTESTWQNESNIQDVMFFITCSCFRDTEQLRSSYNFMELLPTFDYRTICPIPE